MTEDLASPFDSILQGMPADPEDTSVLREAILMLSRAKNAELVKPILTSKNASVVANGLHVVSEAGVMPDDVLQLVLMNINHPSAHARHNLANIVLCSYENLTIAQLTKSLALASDSYVDVRCKAMEVLCKIDLAFLLLGIERIESPTVRGLHMSGYSLLARDDVPREKLIATAISRRRVESSYAGAKLLRIANNSAEPSGVVPGRSEIASYLNWRFKSISKWRC
jgi:hypothetical protein